MSYPDEVSLDKITRNLETLQPWIRQTPIMDWRGPGPERYFGAGIDVQLKLEMLQVCGSFKPRGALTVLSHLSEDDRKRGIIAVSAGNHAISAAYAGAVFGTNVHVVMPRSASPVRIARCRELGAELHLVETTHEAFDLMENLRVAHGWTMVHPFEGPYTTLGTATIALEWTQQTEPLDAVVIPLGGGGLMSGMAKAFRQIWPKIRIFGVEPFGADSMYRSLEAGTPQTLEKVSTIADSLGAPFALPYSFARIRETVEQVVRVTDDELIQAMRLIHQDLHLVTEPAAAAASAAIAGPLRETLQGMRVGAIVCGATIDTQRFATLLGD